MAEEYEGHKINIWELQIPPSTGGAPTEIRLYVFVNDENVTNQLDNTGCSADDLMILTKSLIDKRLAG
jgi:hypothetical protein